MSYELLVSALGSRIYLTKMRKNKEGKEVPTLDRTDVTIKAVGAVMQHMQGRTKTHEDGTIDDNGYTVNGVGSLIFIPQGYEAILGLIVNKKPLEESL